jgi:hypothetical protein
MTSVPIARNVAAAAITASLVACAGGASTTPTALPPITPPAPPTPAPPAPEPTVDPALAARGQEVYVRAGCTACHAIQGVGAQGVVAPALDKIGALALDRIASDVYRNTLKDQPPARTAEEYILQSILYPNAYVHLDCPQGPCQAGSMPNNYRQVIRDEADMAALVAYLSFLR